MLSASCSSGMTPHASPRTVDVHALPAMLTELRLPSFHRHWSALAERADKEGWPAARFLAALAELELAERETRRIRRHLIKSQLPGGKTMATFDFHAIPGVPRTRVEALAAGDWIETVANIIVIGNSGAGKTHLLCAIGHALVETGRAVGSARNLDLGRNASTSNGRSSIRRPYPPKRGQGDGSRTRPTEAELTPNAT